jgi:hypothetical protein
MQDKIYERQRQVWEIKSKMNIGIELPINYVTQKCAVLGTTGSGKSYGAGDIIEEFLKEGLPFVLFDVAGAHYGLAEKFPVVIYGGSKGLELYDNKGKEYAESLFNNNIKAVIFDLSHWNDYKMQLFFADFATRLFELHALDKKPRHLFVEEAEVFFPQQGYDQSKISLLAGNRVMKRGRGFGLGMTLISQRPQDVNKKTLSQSQCTFLLHLEGVQEIEVVRKMLRSLPKEEREVAVKRIVEFKQGECLLYSPSWLGKVGTFKFRKRETFHAGDTPEMDVIVKEPMLMSGTPLPMPHKEERSEEVKKEPIMTDKQILVTAIILGTMLFLVTKFT